MVTRHAAVMKMFGEDMKGLVVHKTALSRSPGSSGGFLVPSEVVLTIESQLHEIALFHALALNVPMNAPTAVIPTVDFSATHETGQSPLYGGLTLTWGYEENEERDEANPNFAAGQLVARDLEAYVAVSNQLVADGGEALGVYLTSLFTEALRAQVEYQCFRGDGVKKPLGILNAPALVTVARAGADAVAQADLAKMVRSLVPACFPRAVWACSVTALEKVTALSVYHANPSAEPGSSLCGVLFGRPLFVTEKLPAVGTNGDVVLFDPKMYALGRYVMEVGLSPHARFLNNQTVYRLLWRGDGQPIPRGTMTLADGATVAGAFVALGAAA